MTKELIALLIRDPGAAKSFLQQDLAASYWFKQALRDISRRDPTDVLFELDVLLNVFEAVCDHLLGMTPRPHSRVRRLAEETATPSTPPTLDQFPGEIVIGGTLDRLLLPEFLAAIHGASVCVSFDDKLFAPQTETELLRALDHDHHLHFYNPFALEGEFLSLEEWLIEHQLAFRRTSTGTAHYQAERVEFRKGLQTPQRMAVDPAGRELILRDDLRTVFRYLKEGRADDATMLLEHVMSVSLQPLPPFRIADTLPDSSASLAQLY